MAAAAPKLPVYTPGDVARHNAPDDCWVTLLGRVLDLTALVSDSAHGALVDPILDAAGGDVSHWFLKESGESGSDGGSVRVKTFVHPQTNVVSPFLPMGRFVHVPPTEPTTAWAAPDVEWWNDDQYVVGRLTTRVRRIRLVNTLTSQEHIVDFGAEETVLEMAQKYAAYNSHCGAYIWKAMSPNGEFRPLDMSKTLSENGLEDDGELLDKLGLDADAEDMLPTICLSFADDLTVA